MSISQNTNILAWLKQGKTITPILALGKFGSFRLGARIYDLRRRGHPIMRRMVPVGRGKRVAQYWLAK